MSLFVKHLAKEIINYANEYEARIEKLKKYKDLVEDLKEKDILTPYNVGYFIVNLGTCEECLQTKAIETICYCFDNDEDEEEYYKELCESCVKKLEKKEGWESWDIY